MKIWNTELIAAVFLVLIFVSTVVRPPVELHDKGDTFELGQVILKVQDLSHQSDKTDIQNFQQDFEAAMQALLVTAGLSTVIVMSPDDDNSVADVVVTVRIPYLISAAIKPPPRATCATLQIHAHLMVDTSIILIPDTPPPIAG